MPLRRRKRAIAGRILAQAGMRLTGGNRPQNRTGGLSSADRLIRMLREHGLPPFKTEHAFAVSIGRQWRFDIAWPSRKVAVEIEGGIFGKGSGENSVPCPTCKQTPKGAHGTVSGILRDCEKYNAAVLLGWRVYRVPTHLVTWETVRTISGLVESVARIGSGRVMSHPRRIGP